MIIGQAQARVLVAEENFLAAQHTRLKVIAAGFSVVRAIYQGAKVLPAVAELKPDILVMSAALPGQSSTALTRQLMAERPLAIILLTKSNDEERMKEAICAGACSYLPKPVTTGRLSIALKFAAIHARQLCREPIQ